jgi:hypothetical protein
MKHLKSFENINYNNLKKYIIWKDPIEKREYDILEIYDFKHGVIYVNFLYSYKNKLRKINMDYRSFISDSFYNIKYTSDDLQDCIDKIYTIADSEKYNL